MQGKCNSKILRTVILGMLLVGWLFISVFVLTRGPMKFPADIVQIQAISAIYATVAIQDP